MNTADTIFLNWHILITIWKVEHGLTSERDKATFHNMNGDRNEYLDITFFRLFGVDSRRIYNLVKGGKNISKKDIDRLANITNISRRVFEGTRLLIPVSENDDLYSTFVRLVVLRKKVEHPSRYRELYNDITKYLKGCKKDIQDSKPIDSELQKAFTFISKGHSSVESQQFIVDMAKSLSSIKYKKLLDIDNQYLYTYLKELRKQEKLVTTAIIHNKNVK